MGEHDRRTGPSGVRRRVWVGAAVAAAVGLGAAVVPHAAAPAAAATAVGPGGFTALPGARVLDTRSSGGARLAGGQVRTVPVTGRGGVPAAGVGAVAVTVTVTGGTAAGHVAVYPGGTDWPGTSTVNYAAGQTVADQAMVAVAADGTLAVRSGVGPVHVLVDVTGWYAAGASTIPGGFVPVAPRRLLDTRTAGGALAGSGVVATVPVAGTGGVPADASAAVVTVTAVRPAADTYVSAWPAGATRPATSLINLRKGAVLANMAVLGLGSGGAIAVSPGGAVAVDVLVDLLGYYTPGPAAPGGFQPVLPRRLVDTRSGGGPLRAGETVEARVTGRAGVPLSRVAAVMVNLTAVPATGTGGYLTAWPSGAARPATSALNPTPAGPVAAAGVFAVGADGGLDAYASAGTVHLLLDVTGYVVAPAAPVAAPTLGADLSPLTGAAQARARALLAGANRYTLRTWWPGEGSRAATAPTTVTDPDRRLGMSAFALAVALSTGGYDPAATGVDEATATATTIRMIDAVTGRHRSTLAGGWGATWQSGMNASLAGRAAWLLWDRLPADSRERAGRMVEFEADQSLLVATRYYRDRTGAVRTGGDTGAEEDSWFALAPALAAAMFPAHPHRTAWVNRQEQLLVAAWARPSSVGSASTVDGRALSSWLAGSNVEPNGTLINHLRVAPDYSTTTYQSIDTLLFSALAGRPAPQATTWGLHPVYTAQVQVGYATPKYRAPGGTVYSRTTAKVYYPQGCDWGEGQQLPYALADTQAVLFGFDATGTAAGHADRHAAAAVAQQARSATGAFYPGDTTEYTYKGREQHSAQLAAQIYLSWYAHDRLHPALAATVATWSPGGRLLTSLVAGTAGTSRTAPFDESRLQDR